MFDLKKRTNVQENKKIIFLIKAFMLVKIKCSLSQLVLCNPNGFLDATEQVLLNNNASIKKSLAAKIKTNSVIVKMKSK